MSVPLRVLLVEDSEDDAELMAHSLRRSGFDVTCERVDTAAAMERALAAAPWDVVVSDYSLPSFGGLGALEIAQRANPDLPFIVVSGTITEEMAVAAMRAGAQDYVLKNNLARLGPVISRELRDARLRDTHRKVEAEMKALEARSAAELARSRDQLDVILRGVAEGIVAQNDEGRVVYVNDAAARVIGSQRTGELEGVAPADVLAERLEVWDEAGTPLSPDDLPGRRALEANAPIECVLRTRRRGTRDDRWHIVTSTPIAAADGRARMVISIMRDVTDLKRTEDATRFLARASEAFVASLELEATLDAAANVAVPFLADWCAVEVVDPPRSTVAHPDPEAHDALRHLLRRASDDPESAFGTRRVLATGEPEVVDDLVAHCPLDPRCVMIVPLRARGASFGTITYAMTGPRKYTLDDLRLAEELARRASLAMEKARLFRDSQEAIRVRDEFLSVASHELRTPVTALMLTLEALQRMPDATSAALPARLEKAIRSTKRLARLIDDLLDVSRITTGRLTVQREDLDLCDAAREVVDRFREAAARAGSRIEVHADGAIRGSWDRLRLEQVITNLVSNAIKYGAGREITIDVGGTATTARLVVRDRGQGIADEDVARIFQKFERAVSARHFGGLGLGLFIARQIVEAHGGSIQVDSRLGGGSAFTVELPRWDTLPRVARREEDDARGHP